MMVASSLTGCFTIDEGNVSAENQAPTNLLFSEDEFPENSYGTVATISVVDQDLAEVFSFEVSDSRFEIDKNANLKIKKGSVLDYEEEKEVTITVTVTDSFANRYSEDFTIEVVNKPDTYEFENRALEESSVSYTGQIARHVLIKELDMYIASGLKADIESGDVTTREQALEKLMFFYKTTEDSYETSLGQHPISIVTEPAIKQTVLADISSSPKDLFGKVAGNDVEGQHKDWSTEFVAFGAKGSQSPSELIEALFGEIADNAAAGTRQDSMGNDIDMVYLASDGRDLKQLVNKILLGSVAYSQATDDYLDDDDEGKGLLADNSALVTGQSYTSLEHQFDEGAGYFGASTYYFTTIGETVTNGLVSKDINEDGMIDLVSEYNFGYSEILPKRDLAVFMAENDNSTRFSFRTSKGLLEGRDTIAETHVNALVENQMITLTQKRDAAILAWEQGIAATIIHHINNSVSDYGKWDTDEFSYKELAMNWSALKGFLINLQFNPNAVMTASDLEILNTSIGDAPVLTTDEAVAAYVVTLEAARTKIQEVYAAGSDSNAEFFDDANVAAF